MSEYASSFVKDFVHRTNSAIQSYNGEYDATILLNCLLGMLVVPFETNGENLIDAQTSDRIEALLGELKTVGRYKDYGKRNPAYKLLRHLRNSIAHFHVSPVHENGVVWGFTFTGYAVNKECEWTGETCPFKNEINNKSPKILSIQLTIEEIKRLASIVCEQIISL